MAWWAQFSAAVNAAWARHMGYAFLVVDERHPSVAEQGAEVDVRFAKVRAVKAALQGQGVELVLWLDADAVVVSPDLDVRALAVRSLTAMQKLRIVRVGFGTW